MVIVTRIVANPNILGGKPIIEGTRISVELVLGLLSNGMTIDKIIESYPILSEESIPAVLDYAARALSNDIVIESTSYQVGPS